MLKASSTVQSELMSICLTDEEIAEVTGRKHRDAQRTGLARLGIEHLVRPDGSLVVSREHFEEVLGGKKRSKAPPEYEPDWDALRESTQTSRAAQPDWAAAYAQERERVQEKKARERNKKKAIRERRRAIQAATIAELKSR